MGIPDDLDKLLNYWDDKAENHFIISSVSMMNDHIDRLWLGEFSKTDNFTKILKDMRSECYRFGIYMPHFHSLIPDEILVTFSFSKCLLTLDGQRVS